jgi:hypothetical protein
MRRYFSFFAFLMLILLLASCGPAGGTLKPEIYVAQGVRGRMLAPKDLGVEATVVHEVEVEFQGGLDKFTATTDFSRSRISGRAISPEGKVLFEYHLENGRYVLSDDSAGELPFEVKRFLGDLQMVYYPVEMVAHELKSQALLVQERTRPSRMRTFMRADTRLFFIKYDDENSWKANVTFKHREQGYEMRLKVVKFIPKS